MSKTLVTGGAKHLGKEICLTLAKGGHDLVVHYHRSKSDALDVVKECISYGVSAEAIQGDFSRIESVQSFIQDYQTRFPKTKNIINNVGNYLIKSALQTTISELSELFQVNVYAPFLLIQALVPSIINEKGNIITIGVAGLNQIRAENYSTAYTLSKMNLLMLTKTLAKELASFDVAVNMVSPGVLNGSIDALEMSSHIPMKRLGTYSQVAQTIEFLLKSEQHYITGQNIEVAGGVRL